MRKLFLLTIRRMLRQFLRGIRFNISIIFLVFSAAVSLMILLPNCFDRIPIYSYFIREFELPITYELSGKVEIVDIDGNPVVTNIDVYVGGYTVSADLNGEYVINFSAPVTSKIFVVIQYTDLFGKIVIKTEHISLKRGVHKFERRFIYNV